MAEQIFEHESDRKINNVSFTIDGRNLKDLVFELSNIYQIFSCIYKHAEHFTWRNEWEVMAEVCRENNIKTKEELINHWKNCPLA